MAIFKASIDLFVDVENEAEACDAVAETLRDHLRRYAPESCVVDWRYSSRSDASSFPVPATAAEVETLED